MSTYLRPAAMLLLLLTLITGVIYPALVTLISQTLLPEQANGSMLKNSNNQIIGSALLGQAYTAPHYFWSRPSATSPFAYNAAASSGSNLGPTNPALLDLVSARIAALKQADPGNSKPVPIDLVTASASGLDPHISVAAAEYQLKRIAKLRKISEDTLRELVKTHTEGRQWRILGEPRVNVLQLNLALDQAYGSTAHE